MYSGNVSRTTIALARARLVNQATRRAASGLGRQMTNSSGKLSLSRFNKTSGSSNTSNAMLDALNKSQDSKKYTAIKSAASGVQKYAGKLLEKGDSSLFGKALAEADKIEKAGEMGGTEAEEKKLAEYRADITDTISNMVEKYNAMIDKLLTTGGTLNNFYAGQLDTCCSSYESELKAVGITVGSDGNLKVNSKTLKTADLEKLQKLFGTANSLGDQINSISSRVEKNADTNLAYSDRSNYTTTYGRYGTYNSYDYRGSSLNQFG